MATKRTAKPEVSAEEETIVTEQAEEPKDLEQAKEELAALRAQIAEMQKPRAGKETDYDRVHRIEKETAEAGKDPWTVMVDVLVPHREKTEDPWYWINVNGQSVQVPANDRYFELKLPWAAALTDMIEAEWHASDFQDGIEVFDPVTNPHRN